MAMAEEDTLDIPNAESLSKLTSHADHGRITSISCAYPGRPNRDLNDDTVFQIASLCPSLTTLDLSGCERVTDDALAYLGSQAPRLQTLRLWGCRRVGDEGIASLAGNCTRLSTLLAADMVLLSDVAVEAIASSCPSLTALDLSRCVSVTNAGIRLLAHGCRDLAWLDLHGVENVTEPGVAALAASCPSLGAASFAPPSSSLADVFRNASLWHAVWDAQPFAACPAFVDAFVNAGGFDNAAAQALTQARLDINTPHPTTGETILDTIIRIQPTNTRSLQAAIAAGAIRSPPPSFHTSSQPPPSSSSSSSSSASSSSSSPDRGRRSKGPDPLYVSLERFNAALDAVRSAHRDPAALQGPALNSIVQLVAIATEVDIHNQEYSPALLARQASKDHSAMYKELLIHHGLLKLDSVSSVSSDVVRSYRKQLVSSIDLICAALDAY